MSVNALPKFVGFRVRRELGIGKIVIFFHRLWKHGAADLRRSNVSHRLRYHRNSTYGIDADGVWGQIEARA